MTIGVQPYGTVFTLSTNANDPSSFSTLYTFTNAIFDASDGFNLYDGAYPASKLVLSGSVLFGTTVGDGAHTTGTLFGIDTANNNNFAVFYNFPKETDSHDIQLYGSTPAGDLILSAGTLYGTTALGGENGGGVGDGVAFSVLCAGTIDQYGGGSFTVLHSFGDPTVMDDGTTPYAGFVQKTGN